MKTFTSLVIGCSLALAGVSMAQQPDDQASPKPDQAQKGKGHGKENKPAGAPAREMKPAGTPVERHEMKNAGPGGPKLEKAEATPKPAPSIPARPKAVSEKAATPNTSAEAATASSPTPDMRKKADERRTGNKARDAAKTAATPATAATPVATPTVAATAAPTATVAATAAPTAAATASPIAGASPNPAISNGGANERMGRGGRNPGAAAFKKPDQQKVEQIKVQHANFKAQPKPEKVPPVTFTANRRVEGSDRWQGQQYEAFRSYHSERHDRNYYHSHYQRVELIGGGYYYWDSGYWRPAWGYDDAHQYYAYDGPIYTGQRAEPLDRVIADVQGVLQEMGYYKGEVDGLLGPLTREALTSYQEEQGLASTAAIDEPTLDALGMGS